MRTAPVMTAHQESPSSSTFVDGSLHCSWLPRCKPGHADKHGECTYKCTYTCTYKCTYVCTYKCTYVCTHKCTYRCTYNCTCMCIYNCPSLLTSVQVYLQVSKCTYKCTYHLGRFLLWMMAVSCPKWVTLLDCFQHTCTDLIRSARLISARLVSPNRWMCQSYTHWQSCRHSIRCLMQ